MRGDEPVGRRRALPPGASSGRTRLPAAGRDYRLGQASASTSASSPGTKRSRPRGRLLSATRLLPDGRRLPAAPPTSACAAADLRLDARAEPFEEHDDPTRVEDVERARLELRAEKPSDDRGCVVGLDDERGRRPAAADAGGSSPFRSAPAARASRTPGARGRSRRRSSRPCRPSSRSSRRRARASRRGRGRAARRSGAAADRRRWSRAARRWSGRPEDRGRAAGRSARARRGASRAARRTRPCT